MLKQIGSSSHTPVDGHTKTVKSATGSSSMFGTSTGTWPHIEWFHLSANIAITQQLIKGTYPSTSEDIVVINPISIANVGRRLVLVLNVQGISARIFVKHSLTVNSFKLTCVSRFKDVICGTVNFKTYKW